MASTLSTFDAAHVLRVAQLRKQYGSVSYTPEYAFDQALAYADELATERDKWRARWQEAQERTRIQGVSGPDVRKP